MAARLQHTVLLTSNGTAVACLYNEWGQCNIPPLNEGMSYTQVSADVCRIVLLRSDGTAVACGDNQDGRCNIPPLDEGMSYIQVSAGWGHTVLLRRRQSTWTVQHSISGIVCQPSLHSSRQLPCPCFAIGLCLSRWCIWCWPARVWQGMRSCALQQVTQVGLTLRWTLTGKLPRSWMKTFTVSEWSCRMDNCWLHSDESIDQTFRSNLGRAGAVHSCGPGHRWTIRSPYTDETRGWCQSENWVRPVWRQLPQQVIGFVVFWQVVRCYVKV